MREFLGIGGYTRPAEGYLSWQHLVFVTSLVAVMIGLAVVLGLRNREKGLARKNRVLIWAAIGIDGIELLKIAVLCIRSESLKPILHNLPLFLCSIQLITIPLAAFARGRLKDACQDFICIFGLLGALLGTYAAGNNYGSYPVLSLDNVASGITHCISGFTALYIFLSKMASMKKNNIGITFVILICFCIAAYAANVTFGGNYMFLMGGDGTPYDILYNLLNGNKVLYPLGVVVLFLVYISLFYLISFLTQKKKVKESV